MKANMKLHELLPVESGKEVQMNKLITDLTATFLKKHHLFEEKRVRFVPSVEDLQETEEVQSTLSTRVVDELRAISGHINKSLDASFAVAVANTVAKADIIIDEDNGDEPITLATGVPATALLELEKRMGQLLGLAKAIPVIDSARGFTYNADSRTYIARENERIKTRKTKKVYRLAEATKEHKEQAELCDFDEPIGKIIEHESSGKMSPADKHKILDKIEVLTRAIKQARARANATEVPKTDRIGAKLTEYIFG